MQTVDDEKYLKRPEKGAAVYYVTDFEDFFTYDSGERTGWIASSNAQHARYGIKKN